MRRSEIKLGGEYAASSKHDYLRFGGNAERVRVVDLGPFMEASHFTVQRLDLGVIDGTPTTGNYRRVDPDDPRARHARFVAVREYDRDGNLSERVYFRTFTQLKSPWEQYLKDRAVIRQTEADARQRERERAEADRQERAALAELAGRVGVDVDFMTRPSKVIISRVDLRRLVEFVIVSPRAPFNVQPDQLRALVEELLPTMPTLSAEDQQAAGAAYADRDRPEVE